jgi:hypothetical protein
MQKCDWGRSTCWCGQKGTILETGAQLGWAIRLIQQKETITESKIDLPQYVVDKTSLTGQ